MLLESKQQYAEFYAKNKGETSLFNAPEWFDGVCGPNNWIPFVISQNSKPVGLFPLMKKSRYGIPYFTQPYYTPNSGMLLVSDVDLDLLKSSLITKKLPGLYWLSRDFSTRFSVKDWTDLGLEAEERTRYHIDPQVSFDELKSTFRKDTKQQVNKGKRLCTLEKVHDIQQYLDFYEAHSFEEQEGMQPMLQALHKSIKTAFEMGAGWILFAKDKKTEAILAAAFFVEDDQAVYYVSAVMNKEQSRSGASRFLIANTIQESLAKGKRFDFCGGNIPSIGKYFASFGASKTSFIHIKRSLLSFVGKW